MASLLRPIYYGVLTVLYAIVLGVDCVLLRRILHTVLPLIEKSNIGRNRGATATSDPAVGGSQDEKSGDHSQQVMKPGSPQSSTSSHFESVLFQFRLTIAASVFLVLQTTIELLRLTSTLAYYLRDSGVSDFNDSDYNAGIFLCEFIISVSAYLCILSVYIVRLRSTFTAMRSAQPPQWFFHLIYSSLIIAVLCGLLSGFVNALVSSRSASTVIAAMLLAVSQIIYLSCSISATGMFVHSTLKLGKQYTDPNKEASGAGETQASLGLIHVAVRLSVCVGVSLLSTCLSIVMLVLVLTSGTPFSAIQPTHVMFNLLFMMDAPINLFSLLCCFKQNESVYQFVFGKLHRYILNLIAPSVVTHCSEITSQTLSV